MLFAGKSENTGFDSMGPKKRVLQCMAALSQGTKLPHCTLGLITEIIMIPQSALLPSTCENQPGGASFCLWPPFPRRLISYRKTFFYLIFFVCWWNLLTIKRKPFKKERVREKSPTTPPRESLCLSPNLLSLQSWAM